MLLAKVLQPEPAAKKQPMWMMRAQSSANEPSLGWLLAVVAAAAQGQHAALLPRLDFKEEDHVVSEGEKEAFMRAFGPSIQLILSSCTWHDFAKLFSNTVAAETLPDAPKIGAPRVHVQHCPPHGGDVSPANCSAAVVSFSASAHESFSWFATEPLGCLHLRDCGVLVLAPPLPPVDGVLPFSLAAGGLARAGAAMMGRFAADLETSACSRHEGKKPETEKYTLGGFLQSAWDMACEVSTDAEAITLQTLTDRLSRLLPMLEEQRSADTQAVIELMTRALLKANTPDIGAGSSETATFRLQQFAGSRVQATLPFLVAATLSTTQADDLQRINPLLSPASVADLNLVLALAQLTTVRLAQLSRCIRGTRVLQGALSSMTRAFTERGVVPGLPERRKLGHLVSALVNELTARRVYVQRVEKPELHYEYAPALLSFEFSTCFLLRARQYELVQSFLDSHARGESRCEQMIMGQGKTTVIGPILALVCGIAFFFENFIVSFF
jgi:hypothetical protein